MPRWEQPTATDRDTPCPVCGRIFTASGIRRHVMADAGYERRRYIEALRNARALGLTLDHPSHLVAHYEYLIAHRSEIDPEEEWTVGFGRRNR